MFFIYDAEKDQSNLAKHGISPEDARMLWRDDHLIEIGAAYRRERRRMVIAKCDGMYWSAIITYRGSVTRIISVRPSTEKEKRIYDKNRYRNNR